MEKEQAWQQYCEGKFHLYNDNAFVRYLQFKFERDYGQNIVEAFFVRAFSAGISNHI
jgi:hypothetical protein